MKTHIGHSINYCAPMYNQLDWYNGVDFNHFWHSLDQVILKPDWYCDTCKEWMRIYPRTWMHI